MGKLIDADAIQYTDLNGDHPESKVRVYVAFKENIDRMPTVDAVPVVRGEWIEENTRPRSGVFYCSSCHKTCYDLQPTRLKGWTKRCRYAFCPNCGADMRKDGEQA